MTEHLRDAYFPGTEELGPDEMRLTALGTGMPNLRPSQASASFFLELGNDDKFFFDMGTGCIMNFCGLGVSYVEANKVFLSHLHTDHMGDFMAWYVGGWIERQADGGVEIWGPSGPEPDMGTQYFIDTLVEACKWDIKSRVGRLPEEGRAYKVHEFDYKGMNEVVYDQNGVVVRSWPAKHMIDGPVSYSLEWNGLKFVYGGDCAPNKYYMEYAKDADVAIHECFITVELLMEKFGFPYDLAVNVGTRGHTSPAAWASVMKEVKPRMAIAYHFYNDPGTAPLVFKEILDVYDGPVHLTKDNYVYNITKDDVTVRHLVNTEDTWPLPHSSGNPGTRGQLYPMSDWLTDSEVKFPGIDEYPDVKDF
jgi:ribonuclease Z